MIRVHVCANASSSRPTPLGALIGWESGLRSKKLMDLREVTQRMKRGDEQAFRAFYAHWFDRLFRYHMALVRGDEAMAKDAMQETLLRVVRYIKVFDDEKVFWCWLIRLAKSSVVDEGRKQSRFQLLCRRLKKESIEAVLPDDDELLLALERGLGELSDDDRRLLKDKYFESRSVLVIVGELGVTEKALESRLGRLRRKLKMKLGIQKRDET